MPALEKAEDRAVAIANRGVSEIRCENVGESTLHDEKQARSASE